MYDVEPLHSHHARAGFSCGKEQLDAYITTVATQDAKRDAAAVFILVERGQADVIGYYTLSSFSVELSGIDPKLQKKLPRYPHVPATLMGRLAIRTTHVKQGLGEFLLMDALRRVLVASDQVASSAVVVDAIDDDAKAFYVRYGFLTFANQPMKLYLPMGTIRKLPF